MDFCKETVLLFSFRLLLIHSLVKNQDDWSFWFGPSYKLPQFLTDFKPALLCALDKGACKECVSLFCYFVMLGSLLMPTMALFNLILFLFNFHYRGNEVLHFRPISSRK